MRQQHDLGAFVAKLGQGRQHAVDARGIAHLATDHRHVEVEPHQHPPAPHIDVVERAEALSRLRHQISLPIATALSAMRFEKPHSLSYQDSTRTKVPSMTLTWSIAKIDECGSWLKSIETLGSSV